MASYDDVLRDEFRCRRCNHVWRTEAERREGRGAPWRDSRAMKPDRRSDRPTADTEAEFHRALVATYRRAKSEIGYNATRFIQLVSAAGGQEAARQLLQASAPSDGFTTLWEHGRLDLSVEAQVLRPEFQTLFTDAELEIARDRLGKYGYRPQPGPSSTP